MRQREKDKIRNRNLLLSAAEELFARKGFEKTRISEIADKAGFSKGTVYLYFENKNDLLHQVLEKKFQEAERSITAIIEGEGSFEAKIDGYINRVLNTLPENHRFLRLMMAEGYKIDIGGHIGRRVREAVNSFHSLLTIFFENHSHRIREGFEPADAARLLMAINSAFASDFFFDTSKIDPDEAREKLKLFLFGGLLKPEKEEDE